jgi:hypothetical protein
MEQEKSGKNAIDRLHADDLSSANWPIPPGIAFAAWVEEVGKG